MTSRLLRPTPYLFKQLRFGASASKLRGAKKTARFSNENPAVLSLSIGFNCGE
jgi:hypothetical protein